MIFHEALNSRYLACLDHRQQRQESCVGESGVLSPRDLSSWMKTAWRMRSVEVRSRKVPAGRVRLRTSRNRRSPALVVLACLRPARVLLAEAGGQIVGIVPQGGDGPGAGGPGRQPSPRSSPSACISFTTSNACGRLPIVAACRGIGGAPSCGCREPQGGPHSRPTHDSLRHLRRSGLDGCVCPCQASAHLTPGPRTGASHRGLAPGPRTGAS